MSPRRCAACKYLRRKCPPDCTLSPYFPPNDPQRFACVHRIYGASNVVKMLQQLDGHDLRAQAVDSLYFEAQRRIEDPVYGCVGIITQLHHQIHEAETELVKARAEIALRSSGTTLTSHVQDQTYYHHHHDHDYHNRRHHDQLLEIMESDLNNLLEGQSSSIHEQSRFGPATKAPNWLV